MNGRTKFYIRCKISKHCSPNTLEVFFQAIVSNIDLEILEPSPKVVYDIIDLRFELMFETDAIKHVSFSQKPSVYVKEINYITLEQKEGMFVYVTSS